MVALKKLKCIDSSGFQEGLPYHLLREISVLKLLRDSNYIIKLIDFYFLPKPENPNFSCFVLCFEYADQGDLHHYILAQRANIL